MPPLLTESSIPNDLASLNTKPYNLDLNDLQEPDPELLALLENPPPGNNVIRAEAVDLTVVKKIVSCRSQIEDLMASIEKGLELLEVEQTLLKMILYKGSNQFRNDPGFKALQIIKKSVEKCVDNYPKGYLKNLLTLLPKVLYTNVHLPPVNLAEHAALRVWLCACSVDRVLHTCHLAAGLANQRLDLGHIWEAGAVRLAISSRIWTLFLDLKGKILEILLNLQTCRSHIPVGKSLYTEAAMRKIFTLCNSVAKSEDKTSKGTNFIDYNIGAKVKRPHSETKDENSKIDIGVKLKRSDDEHSNKDPLPKSDEKSKKKTVDFEFLTKIHSLQDLKDFFEKESQQRKSCRKSARTRKLSQDEWKALKKQVLDNFKPKLPNKSIKASRKLIKSAIMGKS